MIYANIIPHDLFSLDTEDNNFFFVPDAVSKEKMSIFLLPFNKIKIIYFFLYILIYPIIIFCLAHSYIVVNI